MKHAARTRRHLAAALLIGTALAAPARADTLREALVDAYSTNPTLQAARANQRATDEEVPIQKSQGLPNASVTSNYIEFLRTSPNSFTSPERRLAIGPDLNVPIYSGGAVKNAVKAAKGRVSAGQADLRGTESGIFSRVVAAYMDVLRNEALVSLSQNQVEVLTVNLQATSDRFEIGDLTRTDVAQSESRLALAEGDLRIGARCELGDAKPISNWWANRRSICSRPRRFRGCLKRWKMRSPPRLTAILT